MTNSVSYSTFNIGRFRGVDYADSELNMNVSHSPDMMNLIPYENGAVRSRNGYENVLSCDGRINGIYSLVEQKETKVLIHHGNKLSEWDIYNNTLNVISCVFPDCKSSCAQMGNKLYIFTGQVAYVYGEYDVFDEDTGVKSGTSYELRSMEEEAYVPITLINSNPTLGGGTKYENVNLLSPKRIVQFSVSEDTTKIYLPTSPIKSVEKIEKLNDDGEWSIVSPEKYSVVLLSGRISFTENLDKTSVSGKDNYRVTYSNIYAGTSEKSSLACSFILGSPDFNPRHIHQYSDASNYDIYDSGLQYITATVDIYLGNNLAENDEIKIRLFPIDKNKKFKFSYIDESDDSTGWTSFIPYIECNAAVNKKRYNKALYQDKVFIFPISDNDKTLDGPTDGDRFYAAYYRVYTYVWKDDSGYYLRISQPYAIYVRDKDGENVIDFDTVDFGTCIVDFNVINDLYVDRINKANMVTKFGASGNMDRLFVAGWDKMREYEFWSEVDNPLYFPDLNYACLGDEDTAIMGWSRINNNQLAIHKNSNGSDPTVYIQSALISQNMAQVEGAKSGTLQLLSTFSVTFPVTEGPAGDGVISQRAFGVLCGEPLSLSEKGVFATKYVADIAADVRYAVPRSYYINPKLKECDLSDAEAIVFNNRYYLSLGDGRVFVADGAQRYAVGGDSDESSFEWFPWDNVPARIWWIADDRLYFGTADGRICRFTDGFMDIDKPVKAYWTSPWLDFGTQTYYKKIKNVVLTCTEPRTDFSEVNIDYIGKNGAKTVKSYLIDNTSHLGVIPSIATNRKAKKVTGLKVRVRSDNAEDFGIMALSFLYIVSGKFKG